MLKFFSEMGEKQRYRSTTFLREMKKPSATMFANIPNVTKCNYQLKRESGTTITATAAPLAIPQL